MKKRILALLFIIICLPSIAKLTGFGNVFSINENRQRISFPDVDEWKKSGFSVIDTWFNDHFGLRDFLIRLRNQIDFSVYGYNKKLLFTKDVDQGLYFHFKSVVETEQIANEKANDDVMFCVENKFIAIRDYLSDRGIDFRFVIAPQKNEVLSHANEQLPVIRPDPNAYIRMDQELEKSELKENYVSVIHVLREKNQIEPVYYQEDFHWNDWGAAVAFGTVINDYTRSKGFDDAYRFEELTFLPCYIEDGQGQLEFLSPLFYKPQESVTVNKSTNASGTFDERWPHYVVWENVDSPVIDGAVLYFGDSYTPPALFSFNNTNCGLIDVFSKTYYCHWNDSKGALKNIPEDVKLVIVEMIESGYSSAFGNLIDELLLE